MLSFPRLFLFNLKRWCRIFMARFEEKKIAFLSWLKTNQGTLTLCFLFHHYQAIQFDPRHVAHNMKLLVRLHRQEVLDASKEGKLLILSSRWAKFRFYLKNWLLLGALQSRVEKVVFYSYVTLTLEVNNPFSRKQLKMFLEKKLSLLGRLLGYVQVINGKKWDQSHIRTHLMLFERHSLIQASIIRDMQTAVRRQKKRARVKEIEQGMKKGIYPLLISKGLSGSYWMRGPNREVLGLFKPFDEEIHAPNNPIGPEMQGALGLRRTRWGCRVGEAAHHEVGAFIVDEFCGFGIVPRTYYASFTHPTFHASREDPFRSHRIPKTKLGSFQEFLGGFVPLHEVPKSEVALLPIDEFQLLVVLDVMIGNLDRHMGNILVGDEKIAAIDHGLCFTDLPAELAYWYWSYFPQGEKPLLPSLFQFLDTFPFEALEWKLRKKCRMSPSVTHRMRERIALFVEGARAGLAIQEMIGLMDTEYLRPLLELSSSLKEEAARQVARYCEMNKSTNLSTQK